MILRILTLMLQVGTLAGLAVCARSRCAGCPLSREGAGGCSPREVPEVIGNR